MKVFVTHSYFYQLDPKQWRNKTPYPPLGTITALAVLRLQYDQVSFYDVALDASPASCISAMKREQPQIVVIYEDGPRAALSVIASSIAAMSRLACAAPAMAAKSPRATTSAKASAAKRKPLPVGLSSASNGPLPRPRRRRIWLGW